MSTSRDRYFTGTFRTLTDYNDSNNTPLYNKNIREATGKVIKYESIADSINVTTDTISHTSNTQSENTNAIFTSEKLDKLDNLEDSVKDLTINNAK